MWLCERKLKVKIAHFRLSSASQKRDCLSSQMLFYFSCGKYMAKDDVLGLSWVCLNHSTERFQNIVIYTCVKWVKALEWFSVECRKTKTKVITLVNHKEHTIQ